MSTLHWLRPEWLYALLLVPLLVWLAWRLGTRRDIWNGIIDPALRSAVLDGENIRQSRWLAPLWVAMAASVAALALAGPSWHRSTQPYQQLQSPLVIAVDLSSASLATDVAPSRLLLMRSKLQQLLAARPDGQSALIAFADDAYTVTPLTDDPANIAVFIDALSPEVMPEDGQRPDRAITRARDLMQQAGYSSGDILLLTDRGSTAAARAAMAARADGFRVSALGVGSITGRPVRTADGNIRMARLDMASLTALAAAGGGRAVMAQATPADVASLDLARAGGADGQSSQQRKGTTWQDNGYWLLLPLMALLLPAFRRGSGFAAVLLLGIALTPIQADAADWWRRPDQQQHARMESGKQAYRKGDYERAAAEYAKVDTADAHYNRGNALAKAGRYDEAIRAYDEALKRQPGMADATANREAVRKAQQQKPPSGGDKQQGGQNRQQGQQQGQQSGSQGGQSQQGQSGNQPPQGGQQSGGQPQGSPQSNNPSQGQQQGGGAQQGRQNRAPPGQGSTQQGDGKTPTPEDVAAQAAADQAQRERMRQAMQGQGRAQAGDAAKAQAAAANESPEQREQRQQVDAWMRRIPDDPGALLRRKFMLERERRRGGGG